MAAQNTDIIDLRRSYIPQDPNAFPITMQTTQAEDSPEQRIPVLPYDGYNFMPTPQGYASFFGVNAKFPINNIYYVEHQDAIPEIVYDDWIWPESATEEAVKEWIIGPEFYASGTWENFVTIDWGYDNEEELLADFPEYHGDIRAFIYYEAWGVPADFIAEFGSDVTVIPDGYVIPAVPEILENIGTEGEVDYLFFIQTQTYENILIALCDDGIWTARANAENEWVHVIDLDIPDEDAHREWSYCVIDNEVYVYRQAEEVIWIANEANNYVFTEATPTGINMEGQLGIFKAGGRLGFWDSENSTAWSSLTDKTAFGDSETLSAATIFQDIVGRIVTILQHGDGFIIYCTKSIVLVRRIVQSAFLFSGSSLYNNNGISYRREVCYGDPDTQHFAMTTQGFVEISNGQAQTSMPEIATWLKESKQPVFLRMLNGRYLHFQFLDARYLVSRVNFTTEVTDGSTYQWAKATKALDDWNSGDSQHACPALKAVERQIEQIYLYRLYGYTNRSQASIVGQVPIWEDRIASLIDSADIEAWKEDAGPGFTYGDHTFFDDKFTAGSVESIKVGGIEYFGPAQIPLAEDAIALGLDANYIIEEENNQNFWHKQDMMFALEERFWETWQEAVRRRSPYNTIDGFVWTTENAQSAILLPTNNKERLGPYVNFSHHSGYNKYYGVGDTSAWLQRSLIHTDYIVVDRNLRKEMLSRTVLPWHVVQFGTSPDPAYVFVDRADFIANGEAIILGLANQYGPSAPNYISAAMGPQNDGDGTGPPASVVFHQWGSFIFAGPGDLGNMTVLIKVVDPTYVGDPRSIGTLNGPEVYKYSIRTHETFRVKFELEPIPTCQIKELGYTEIVGHGHYTDLGQTFVQDNATPQATDYVDICEADPIKKRRPQFNGIVMPGDPFQNGYLCGQAPTDDEIVINGVTYEFPEESIIIPDEEVTLQDGSIEPLHPLFYGAFVFDVQYKKWGRYTESHKILLDIFPINNIAGNAVPYEHFLPKSGALLADGYIYPFDQYPVDSQLIFGKYGSHRHGFTDLQEVEIQHRVPMTGSIALEGSLNGRDTESTVSAVEAYENSRQHKLRTSLSARWYNVVIEGFFDLTYLALNSVRGSRR